jgi:hypothetical protein
LSKPSTPAPPQHIWQSHPPPTPSNHIFTSYRELHRWTQLTLFRAVVLSSRTQSAMEIIQVARQHRHCSITGHWPVSFRSRHRLVILDIHMRALIKTSSHHKDGYGITERMNEAKAVAHDYKALLESCTHFPRADERNEPVEEFVCLLFAFWSANGFRSEWTDWIIEVVNFFFLLALISYINILASLVGDYTNIQLTTDISLSHSFTFFSIYCTFSHASETHAEGVRRSRRKGSGVWRYDQS